MCGFGPVSFTNCQFFDMVVAVSDYAHCNAPGCQRKISDKRLAHGGLYCSSKCSMKMRNVKATQKRRAKLKAEQIGFNAPEAEHARRGEAYAKLTARQDLVSLLRDGAVQHSYVAEVLGLTPAAVSRAWSAVLTDGYLAEVNEGWVAPWHARAMLPVSKLLEIVELGHKGEGTERFEGLADELTHAYSVFSKYYFTLEGKRPLVEPFHERWIRSIIVAYATGGKQLILSPPRHGKSEMLVRFVVWMIVMFPNIRIMWVAASRDVAEIMLGAVKDILENNEELVADTLPKGEFYKPDRQDGKKWSAKEIKVRQQSHVGQKSSSFLALGRTSKILSRDVDILITDDIEDFDTTREPAQRAYSRNKLAEIGTRKEERTAWVYIASRQHSEDIPRHIMQLEGTEQAWRTIVDSAHVDCQLDPDVIDGHDENGCVLFPAVRSYRWLLEKKSEMDSLGIAGAYEMRYLNSPIPESGIVFNIRQIREKALDRSRDLGVEGLPPGKLVAGLDPSAMGVQAGFCWHYTNDTLSMVDLSAQGYSERNEGGFAAAQDLMAEWDDMYGLKFWFYEDNATQSEFFKDPRTKRLILDRGLTVRPYTTGRNKTDPEIGISSMAPWYHEGRVNLPYGTAGARDKVNLLLGQLQNWTTDGSRRKGRGRLTDIKMASWFPFPTIIKWGNEDRQVSLHVGDESSYPGLTSMNSVGWSTPYPGGM